MGIFEITLLVFAIGTWVALGVLAFAVDRLRHQVRVLSQPRTINVSGN